MNKPVFTHYTDVTDIDLSTKYDIHECSCNKPHGLWISNDNDFGWKEWCEQENFNWFKSKYCFEITLKDKPNVLFIKTARQFIGFENTHVRDGKVKWGQVFKRWKGIVIPHYFWEYRMKENSDWYYGWDCASGCIWDLSAVESVRRIGDG